MFVNNIIKMVQQPDRSSQFNVRFVRELGLLSHKIFYLKLHLSKSRAAQKSQLECFHRSEKFIFTYIATLFKVIKRYSKASESAIQKTPLKAPKMYNLKSLEKRQLESPSYEESGRTFLYSSNIEKKLLMKIS